MPTRLPDPPEREFQAHVVDTLKMLGYLVTSIRVSHGVTIGDSGLPDIVAVHPKSGMLVMLELKVGANTPTPVQQQWLDAYAACPAQRIVGWCTPLTWSRDFLPRIASAAARAAIA